VRHAITLYLRSGWPVFVLAGLTVFVVSPYGEFPLNDDWVYWKMVNGLVNEGQLAVHPYSSAYAATQSLIVAPLALLFGLSFTLLRVTTLVAALGVLLATIWCGRLVGLSRNRATLAALIVLINPIFINMSYSFMTEIPFLALSMLSMAFYLKAIRKPGPGLIALGTAFAVLAFLNRQYGLLITLAFFITIVVYKRTANPHAGLRNAFAVAHPWIICVPCAYYLAMTSQTDLIYYAVAKGDWSVYLLPHRVATVIAKSILYCGLFLLPVTLPLLASMLTGRLRWARAQWGVFAIVGGALLIYTLTSGGRLPNLHNIIRDCGLGPLLLHPENDAPNWTPVELGGIVWWPVTLLSVLSSAVLGGLAVGFPQKARSFASGPLRVRYCQRLFLFCAGALMILVPANGIQPVYHDRYILPAIPMLAILAVGALPFRSAGWLGTAAGAAPALALYVFSIFGQQDYMAWNDARWRAIDLLRTKHAMANEFIDGGYEFHGLHSRKWALTANQATNRETKEDRRFVARERVCLVAMRSRKSFQPVLTVPYFSWLGFKTRDIVVLRPGAVSPPESRFHLESIRDNE